MFVARIAVSNHEARLVTAILERFLVSAVQLSSTTFQADSGSDDLWVRL
jgi:hypothetical protein